MDYLYGTPYCILQEPSMYHFSSDTELLGRFLSLRPDDRVLDAGTNNGALLCYAAVQHPSLLCGIDLFPEVIQLAKKNLSMNHIPAELHLSSLQAFEHEPFTVIVCNPPYFEALPESLKNKNPYLYAARHRDYLSVYELFLHSARLLAEPGRIAMVFPYEFSRDVFTAAGTNGFYLKRFAPVYDRQGGTVKRCLFEFWRSGKEPLVLQHPVYLDQLHDPRVINDLMPAENRGEDVDFSIDALKHW